MFKIQILLAVSLSIPALLYSQTGNLAEDFKNPPAEYSLLPFWSWNGTLTAEKLTWQIVTLLKTEIDKERDLLEIEKCLFETKKSIEKLNLLYGIKTAA